MPRGTSSPCDLTLNHSPYNGEGTGKTGLWEGKEEGAISGRGKERNTKEGELLSLNNIATYVIITSVYKEGNGCY
jgi:hypothetical protein